MLKYFMYTGQTPVLCAQLSVPCPILLVMALPPFLGVSAPSPPCIIRRPHAPILSGYPKGGCMIQATPIRNSAFNFTDIGRTSFLSSGVAKLWWQKNGTVWIHTSLCSSAIGASKVNRERWRALVASSEPLAQCCLSPCPLPFSLMGVNTFPVFA